MTKNLKKSLSKLPTINSLELLFNTDFVQYHSSYYNYQAIEQKYGKNYHELPECKAVSYLFQLMGELSTKINGYSHSSNVLDDGPIEDYMKFADTDDQKKYIAASIIGCEKLIDRNELYEDVQSSFKDNMRRSIEDCSLTEMKSFKNLYELIQDQISEKNLEELIQNSRFFSDLAGNEVTKRTG